MDDTQTPTRIFYPPLPINNEQITNFRLAKINEIKKYLESEVASRESTAKKYKKSEN